MVYFYPIYKLIFIYDILQRQAYNRKASNNFTIFTICPQSSLEVENFRKVTDFFLFLFFNFFFTSRPERKKEGKNYAFIQYS